MSQYKRNIMVGVTVVAALIALGWMILRFSDAPFKLFAKKQMAISLVTSTAQGISEGSAVAYKGVPVGRVVSLTRSDDQRFVIIGCTIDKDPPLPANLQGRISSNIFGGGSMISLVLIEAPGTPTTRPRPTSPGGPPEADLEPEPVGELTAGSRLHARYIGLDLLPPEFATLGADLKLTSAEFRATAARFRESDVVGEMQKTLISVRTNVDKAGLLVEDLRTFVNDEKNRKNISEALAQFNEASKTATRVAANLEKLSANADVRITEVSGNANKLLTTTEAQIVKVSNQLSDRLAQTAGVISEFEKAGKKINDGKGTAAQLLNNSALYEELLDTSTALKLTIRDLKRLVEQWEQEGVSFKLK